MSQTADTATPAAVKGPGAVKGDGEVGGGAPDLLYGEAETELRAAVRSLLEDRCDWREVLARTETGQTYDTGWWRGFCR